MVADLDQVRRWMIWARSHAVPLAFPHRPVALPLAITTGIAVSYQASA